MVSIQIACKCVFYVRNPGEREWLTGEFSDAPRIDIPGCEVARTPDGETIIAFAQSLHRRDGWVDEIMPVIKAWHDADPSRCTGRAS